ncbi:MAG: HlyD family efflux transporter periplasmic adaptor subunit [Pirellulales bacterium]
MSKPLASIDRPLALRLRPDLQPLPVEMSGATTWIVKDPVTLEHFQFSAAEYALMDRLRRPVSIAELQRWFEREFAPRTITPQAVWEFLSRLHEAGLVISDAPGQGQELSARMRRERTRNWAMSWTRLLAIRFRGVDPDAFLTATHERCRWLFSKPALAVATAVVLYALWLVVGHFDEFRSRLPELAALVDARNLTWLLLAIGGVKVLHELGHALACKHFGGEVRELGFMLLVFAPCLYCDVSDAWRLTSKWRRIAVSAAGVLVELTLAAVATIVWWHAEPGILKLVALDVMIICTVNTLLVNGNPLLRYDGYYILSDLAETPNLWQRSRDVLRRWTTHWLFASRAAGTAASRWSGPGDDPLVPARQRPWLALYAMASKLYLTLVFVTIVWGLVQFLYPYHLQNLAYAVGLTVLGSALVGPVTNAVRLARNPLRRGELRTGRLALITALGLASAVAVLSLPVNYYVKAPVVLLPEDALRVYATIEGTLVEARPAGANVKRGEIIGKLENIETGLELARLEGEQRLRQMRVEHLERLRGLDRQANDELPTARAALTDSERRLAELRRETERLTLTAPADGMIISAPRTEDPPRGAIRLATWSGSLLEPTNRGAHVEPGTLVCLIGDPSRLNAVLLVDDTDVKRLEPGQRALLRIEQLPGQVIEGEVVDVARHDVRDVDSEPAGRADLASLFNGVVPPGKTGSLYQARVRFDSVPQKSLVIGGRGEAKVAAERITLARRILRYFMQTFRLPM